MSILVRGMTMPKNCWHCELSVLHLEHLWCRMLKEEIVRAEIDANCPLVEIPPHGRLIEEEPIIKYITDGLNIGRFGYDAIEVLAEIKYAPTIIPAKDGE